LRLRFPFSGFEYYRQPGPVGPAGPFAQNSLRSDTQSAATTKSAAAMTFLPIVGRELRTAARRGGTYWMRWAAAFVALGGAAWIYALSYSDSPKETGYRMFVTLAILANLYALLSGLRTTADCLSEEKREGTLGLLFLTDLKGYDIVLGKLAATSLNAFYGLLAMFPIIGVVLLMGGVTPGEFGRVVLVSINNLLFSLTAGLFFSSVSREDRKAMGATLLLLLVAAALPLIGLAIAASQNRSPSFGLGFPLLIQGFFIPSPSFTCFAAFDTFYGTGGFLGPFWLSFAVIHGTCWLFLILASLIVPTTWQEKITASGGHRRQWHFGTPQGRLRLRQRLLDANPILWLTSRERFKQVLVFGTLGALAVIFFWGYARLGRDWFEVAWIPATLIGHTVLKMWFSGEACRRFCEDRRSGALELLLATPLTVPQILNGQRLALWRQFGYPALAMLLADLLMMAGCLAYEGSEDGVWVKFWLYWMAMLVWDLLALSWVGPWMGLNGRSPNRASMAALVRICVLPTLVFLVGWAFLAVLDGLGILRLHLDGPGWVFFGWFALGGVNNLFFGTWAKRRLRRDFRAVATQRFDPHARYRAWGRALGLFLRQRK
jgi:ABC-type transport system involved in cytochrome c biogenesis permease component